MTYIIEKDKKLLPQKIEDCFEEYGCVAELSDEQLLSAAREGIKVEPDYEICVLPLMAVRREEIRSENIMFATIGAGRKGAASYYFRMEEDKWEKGELTQERDLYICCYTESRTITAKIYLKTVDFLHRLSQALGKKLIILEHTRSVLPYFRKSSLTCSIALKYAEKYGSLLLWQEDFKEKGSVGQESDKEGYVVHSWEQVLLKTKKWLEQERSAEKKEDYFFAKLPDDAALSLGPFYQEAFQEAAEKMKSQLVPVGLGRYVIEGTKASLPAEFRNPYFFEVPFMKKAGRIGKEHADIYNPSIYKGEGVYIGWITTQDGDYEDAGLKLPDGTHRVKCVWEQEEGAKGRYWLPGKAEQAERAAAEKSEEVTNALKLMGGDKQGAADRAEFIIARIKQAPKELIELYGGTKDAVWLADVMIAVHQLSVLARLNHKPLILVLPYSSYQSQHPAYQSWLESFAEEKGHLLVLPAGDEADKNKHFICCNREMQEETLEWQLRKNFQKVTGRIEAVSCSLFDIELIHPDGNKISLLYPGSFKLGSSYIETSGRRVNPQTGYEEILWQISPMEKGTWMLAAYKSEDALGKIEIFLESDEPEQAFSLKGSVYEGTLNPSAGTQMISVGSFNGSGEVLYGYSARGNEGKVPDMVVSDSLMEKKKMESTLQAACLTAGVMACLYEKMKKLQGEPTLYAGQLKQQLMLALKRTTVPVYPDKGQGSGILDQEVMAYLLKDEG